MRGPRRRPSAAPTHPAARTATGPVLLDRAVAERLVVATVLLFCSSVLLALGGWSTNTTPAEDGADIGGGLALLAGTTGLVLAGCLFLAGLVRHVRSRRRSARVDPLPGTDL